MSEPTIPISGCVLVVDDDPDNLDLIARRLRADAIACVLVGTGQEGVEQVRAQAFQAVLLDLRLPDIDGIDVMRAIRAIQPTLPVVIMTAHGSPEIEVDVLEKGAAAYLLKPVPRRHLIDILRQAMGESR